MIRTILTVAFALLMQFAYSQQPLPAVIKSSREYSHCNSTEGVQDVYLNSSNKLVIVEASGEKKKLNKSKFWGFRNKNADVFRFFENETYKLVETERFTIYQKLTIAIVGDLIFNDKEYYFSNGLDSPIFKLQFGELKYVFENQNPTFIEMVKKGLRNQDLWKKDDSGFVLVKLYNASLE